MFQSVGKDGVVTSAQPFNHHFQGRGVKTHMGNDFPEAVSNGRFLFLIPGLVGVIFWHSLRLFLLKMRRQYGINTSSDRGNP